MTTMTLIQKDNRQTSLATELDEFDLMLDNESDGDNDKVLERPKLDRIDGRRLNKDILFEGRDRSHENETDELTVTFLAAQSITRNRPTAPRRTNSNRSLLHSPNMSSFRHKSTSLPRSLHQSKFPTSISEVSSNEIDDEKELVTTSENDVQQTLRTTRRSGGRKSRRKKSSRPSTTQRLGQREIMKPGEKEETQSRSPPSIKTAQRRRSRRSSIRSKSLYDIERELRSFGKTNSARTCNEKPVPVVQKNADPPTSATTMVLPDSVKSETTFVPQKQQQRQQQHSPVLKNEYESSGVLSRSTCQSADTDTMKSDTYIIISPTIGIADKSKEIDEQKRNSDYNRFQQHNGVISPRSALLRKSQSLWSVNPLKSIRLVSLTDSPTSKTPLIDSKKKSITSRLFEGLKIKGKGKDKCKDNEMDRIKETIRYYDNGKDDEFTEDKDYNNETVAGAKSGDVKNDNGNNEKESTCVKLLTNNDRAPNNTDGRTNDKRPATNNLNSFLSKKDKGKRDLAHRFNTSLKKEKRERETKEYGLMMSDDNTTCNDITTILEGCDEMMSMISFLDDNTIDLSSHFGGGNKSNRADTIMNRVDDVSGTKNLEEDSVEIISMDSFSNDDMNNGPCFLTGGEQKTKQQLQEYSKNSWNDGVGDAYRANDVTNNEDDRNVVQDMVTNEKIVESKCLQIDFFTFIKKRFWWSVPWIHSNTT
jgi:hypothetical protein